jgi:hypothetical protein
LFDPPRQTKDVRQEAIVTKRAAAQVHVSYRDVDGQQATRVKHPALLVLLDEELHVVQDAQGFLWVKRVANRT